MKEKFEYYQKKLLRVKASHVAIKGFGYFLHGSATATIYARLDLNPPLMEWFGLIRKVFGDNQKFVPHITVVKDIPMASFKKLWPYFEHREFNGYFFADNLVVLSRPTYGSINANWVHFKNMYLKKSS